MKMLRGLGIVLSAGLIVIGMAVVCAGCDKSTSETDAVAGALDALPAETVSLHEVPIRDARELAGMSTVVVVADLREVHPGFFVYREPNDEDPAAGSIEYDGCVFDPTTWIKGGSSVEGDLVVLMESMRLDANGTPVARLIPNGYPIGVQDVGHTYLLFLGPAYDGTVGDRLIPTSAHFGIAEVRADGTLLRNDPKNTLDPLYQVRDQTIDDIVASLSVVPQS